MRQIQLAFRLAFALLAFFPACHAVLVNRTIDSNKGDPVTGFTPTFLSPTPIWADQTCPAWDPKASTGCTIQPDPAKAFDGTWKATTYLPTYKNINFTLNFVGVAIWVYFILANLNEAGDPFTNTNVNFTLDGRAAGNFSHEPDNSTYSLMYNSTVFSRTDLTNSPHTLLVSVNDYDRNTFVCFDWAMYTVELADTNATAAGSLTATPSSTTSASSSSSSSSSSQTGGIVAGSVIGGLAVIGIVVAALLWNRKRQSHKEETDGFDSSPTPFLNASRPSQDVLSVRTQPTSDVTSSSLSYFPAQSREALNAANRRDYGGASSKRAEAHYPSISNFSGSTEPQVDAVGAPVQAVAQLTTQMQELRSQMEQLQGQRESDGAPPAYV